MVTRVADKMFFKPGHVYEHIGTGVRFLVIPKYKSSNSTVINPLENLFGFIRKAEAHKIVPELGTGFDRRHLYPPEIDYLESTPDNEKYTFFKSVDFPRELRGFKSTSIPMSELVRCVGKPKVTKRLSKKFLMTRR